ncbi:sensor histidine kinase [Paenibacillus aestuarii]|uniref:Sensor histidine kinase n=1 Tax=Paenibacillus aestuarii TaxID=516965 RepID=A0ABW0K1K9_9BACL|nr:histidine kinase [Paenibacillus aestuarii]
MNIQRSFNNLSFRQRIHFSIIALILVSVALTGVLLYWIASGVIERNAFKQRQDMMSKSAQVLDEKLQHTAIAGLSIQFSETYDALMKDVSLGIAERYYTHLTSLQNDFSQVKLLEPLIDTIMISSPIGDFYPTTYYRRPDNTIVNSPWFNEVLSAKKVWTARHQDELFANSSEVISYIVKSSSQYSVKDTYMIINLPIRKLSELLSSELEQKSDMLLVTKDGQDILEINKYDRATIPKAKLLERVGNDKKGYFDYQKAGEDYLVNYSFVLDGKWVLFNIQSRAVLLEQMNNFKWIAAAMTLGCLFAALLVSNVLTTLLLKPLAKLQDLMEKVELNDLTVRYESQYHDEVTQVGYKFNSMLQQINTLIEEVAEERQRISRLEAVGKEAELRALKNQIDSHFLYNTLENVKMLAEIEGQFLISDIMTSLGSMMRYSMEWKREYVMLSHEIQHVQHYIFVMNIRYDGRLELRLSIAPECLMQESLKMSLQPLVENAIKHGTSRMHSSDGKLVITISAVRSDQACVIEITDNGCGIPEGKLGLLNRMLRMEESAYQDARQLLVHKNNHDSNGIGLRNVDQRLVMSYGKEYGIQIESQEGSYTRIIMTLPYRSWEGETDIND